MKRMLARAALAGLALTCACAGDGSESPAGGVSVAPVGPVPPFDGTEGPIVGAGIRRMTVDQLQASVPVVAGDDLDDKPIRWRLEGVDAYADGALGKTLGRPDYVNVTAEDQAPSSLYVKFASDMARSVCDQLVTADLAREPEDATLWPAAPIDGSARDEQRRDNARLLALRWLGLSREESDEHVEALVALEQAVEASAPAGVVPAAARGWGAVCIALFEDPLFHLH